MLKIEKTVLPSPEQWEIMIEGMRNPKNSWDKMDSANTIMNPGDVEFGYEPIYEFIVGENDHKLMTSLAKGGAVHAKYRRMIPVFLTINAPLYWWKEFDTYKVGTVANSCSTMHKIHAKEFTMSDFSCEHLNRTSMRLLEVTVDTLNMEREHFLESGSKDGWLQMIQLLPASYNQKRTVMLNYEVLVNIYHSRKNHKLDEWHIFCDWIKGLPYSELITGDE
jgi:hypothetical protein